MKLLERYTKNEINIVKLEKITRNVEIKISSLIFTQIIKYY